MTSLFTHLLSKKIIILTLIVFGLFWWTIFAQWTEEPASEEPIIDHISEEPVIKPRPRPIKPRPRPPIIGPVPERPRPNPWLINGECGSANKGQTPSVPTGNLCSPGSITWFPMTVPVIGTPIVMYTWSCLGSLGWSTAQCVSYQTPTEETETVYNGTQLNTRVTLQQTEKALAFTLNDNNNLSKNNKILKDQNAWYGEGWKDFYYTISPNIELIININTDTNDQFIQFWEENLSGVDFFGCNASGWNVSLSGLVSDYVLYNVKKGENDSDLFWDDLPSNPYMPRSIQDFISYQNINWSYWMIYMDSIQYNINIYKPEDRFFAWDNKHNWFIVSCRLITTVTPPTTQTGDCVGLPAHAIPNTATTITQSYGTNGWSPSLGYNHNTGASTNHCYFTCNTNYTRNKTTLTCEPNTTGAVCSGVLPTNTTLASGTTYLQTRNGSGWAPTLSWTLWGTGSCGYTCDTNYTRNTTTQTCEANTTGATCSGTLPANATVTNGTTYTQTRNGTSWTPTLSWTLWGTGSCGYNTYSRWTGDWGTCNLTGTIIDTWSTVTYSRQTGDWMCPLPINGICWEANLTTLPTIPQINLCDAGIPTTVNGNGPWSWSCSGINWWSNTSCSAEKTNIIDPVNGLCVSYNYAYSAQPATDTADGCLAWQYSDISDDSYRKRQCIWENWGNTTTCDASIDLGGGGTNCQWWYDWWRYGDPMCS